MSIDPARTTVEPSTTRLNLPRRSDGLRPYGLAPARPALPPVPVRPSAPLRPRPPSIAEWAPPTPAYAESGYGTWTPDIEVSTARRSAFFYVALFLVAAMLGVGLGLAAAFREPITYRVEHQLEQWGVQTSP